jgi:transcriptional regulator with XRE-family HTH domain
MGQLRQQFAKRLKELREQRGLTQEELAKASGLSISFIRAIEQGVNAPSFESIEFLAKALAVEEREFFSFRRDF